MRIKVYLLATILTGLITNSSAQYTGGSGKGDARSAGTENVYLTDKLFTGNTSTNFSLAANWSGGTFPSAETGIVPSTATRQPVLSGSQTITAGTNIGIAEGASLTIAPTGLLTVDGGLNNSGTVTLQSNASGTASIGNSSGTITGNVTVERYIPAKRAWRFVAAPLIGSTNNSIFYNWQNNDQIISNYGVEIWSNTNGVADPSNTNSGMMGGGVSTSIRQFVNNAWSSLTNTNGLNSQPTLFNATTNNALCLFVTAPYNNGSTNIHANGVATTLSATGSLIQGTHTKNLGTAAAGDYFLVANPYASSVNPSTISLTNIANNFYMWDPNCVGSYNVGQYITYSRTANTYSLVGGGTGSVYTNSTPIQSGQAFFVQAGAAGAASVTFSESHKVSGSTNVFRTSNTNVQLLRHTLKKTIDGAIMNIDGALGVFYNGANAATDYNDAAKFTNSTENIILRRANGSYAIEERPLITDKDTLFVRLTNTSQSAYTLELTGENFSLTPNLTATLKDAYTNTSLPLSLTDTNRYNFTVDANATSTGDRFMIVFKIGSALPVQFTGISATQKGAAVQVDWKVGTEQNMKDYAVEKSTDGSNFTAMATQTANNVDNSSYAAMDNHPVNGSNYYRVLSTDKSGKQQYSNVAVVKIGGKQSSISVYPNPIVGNVMNVQLENTAKGNYTIQLVNTQGSVVMQSKLQHAGGSGTQSIQLPNTLTSGNYIFKVVDEQGKMFTEKVIMNNN